MLILSSFHKNVDPKTEVKYILPIETLHHHIWTLHLRIQNFTKLLYALLYIHLLGLKMKNKVLISKELKLFEEFESKLFSKMFCLSSYDRERTTYCKKKKKY